MNKIKIPLIAALFTFMTIAALMPATAVFAEQVVGQKTCADIKTASKVVKCDNTGGDPIMSLVRQISNFLAVGVGILVVGGIVWGSMLYVTSNGESGKAQQGITVIVNSVIGLLLFIFMYAIISFLTPGDGFLS